MALFEWFTAWTDALRQRRAERAAQRQLEEQARAKRAQDIADLKALIMRSVADGKVTPEEETAIRDFLIERGLTSADYRTIRLQAYQSAALVAKNDGRLDPEEWEELERIRGLFGITQQEAGTTRIELERMRLLTEIKDGKLPSIAAPNVLLKKGEICHWKESADLIEERVISRKYQGGSQGVSIRIAKGVNYRVGAQRGRLVTETGNVPVSSGDFIITSQRVVFAGDRKSFDLSFGKLINIQLAENGIILAGSTGKPKTVMFSKPGNGEILGAILQAAINNG